MWEGNQMNESTLALLIMGIILILYLIPKMPLSVTTVFGMLAMAMTGIISFETAFAGFASNAVLLVAGMIIIGRACFTTGLAELTGGILYRFVGNNEKRFVLALFIMATILSIFLNGTLIVSLLITIIDSIVSQSNGTITRKNTYFPLGMASTLGNNLTTISGTSMITALAIYYEAGYRTVGLFEPTLINLPAILTVFIIYMLFGYRLQNRIFDFNDIPVIEEQMKTDETKYSVRNMTVTGCTLIIVTIALIAGMNYGAAALAGAGIVIITGCVSEKEAYSSISWTTIITVAGAIGISAGFVESGAGEFMANQVIQFFGNIGKSPFGMCVVLFFLGTLVSNVMSDNAAAAMTVPIALAVAQGFGCDPLPFVLAAASGVKDAIATPISVATMTMVQPAGYRFKHYFLVGGMVNLVMVVIGCVMIRLIYYF